MSDVRSIFKVLDKPGHSRSIVSGTPKFLKEHDFVSGPIKSTVRYTVNDSRWEALEADSWRKRRDAVAAMRRELGSKESGVTSNAGS